jgi:hypothetical protein
MELGRAREGSYDSKVIADVAVPITTLEGQFDLIVSWQVMEHVKAVPTAMTNLRSYRRPGGEMVAEMSGAFYVVAAVKRLLPQRVSAWSATRLARRRPDTVFRAYYDHCWYTALQRLFCQTWAEVSITPLYTGAYYFGFSRLVTAVYIAFEEWMYRRAITISLRTTL